MRVLPTALVAFLAACAPVAGVDELPSGPGGDPAPSVLLRPASPFDGEIIGVLHDRSGRPMSDVLLKALRADRQLDFPPKTVGRSMSSMRWARQLGLPWWSPVSCTDANGEFRSQGLPPGAYDVYLLSSERIEGLPPITASPVSTGDRRIELVADAHRAREQRRNLDAEQVHGPSGTLSVTVRSPDGRPYDMDNQVRVSRLPGGEVVRHSGRYNKSPWYQTELAPGRYVVRASANDCVPWCSSGSRLGLARFGSVERECEILEGQPTELELVLLRGGRVRVALPLPGPARDPLLARALAVPEPMGANEFAAALKGGPAGTARLVDADGGVIRLSFFAPRLKLTYRYMKILPGTHCLSYTIVPPGVYRLEVSMPGYTASATQVEIRADEITDVRLPLSESRGGR